MAYIENHFIIFVQVGVYKEMFDKIKARKLRIEG